MFGLLGVKFLGQDRRLRVRGHVQQRDALLDAVWHGVVDGVGGEGLEVHQELVGFLQAVIY